MSVYIENGGLVDDELKDTIIKSIEKSIQMMLPDEKTSVSLTFCDDTYIRQLNEQYRGINKETDVLSFPLLEANSVGNVNYSELDFDPETEELMLGDIVISVERAKDQAVQYGHKLERELCYLCVHSVLHLFGYDHMNDDDKNIMRQKEEQILAELGIER